MAIKEMQGLDFHLRCDAVYCEGEEQWYVVYSMPMSRQFLWQELAAGNKMGATHQWVTHIRPMATEPLDGYEEDGETRKILGEVQPDTQMTILRVTGPIHASKQHRDACRSVEMGLASLYIEAAYAEQEQREAAEGE